MPEGRLIGNWGIKLIFKVGLNYALTFRDASRTVEGRWAEHEIMRNVPRLERLGPGIGELRFTMDLSVFNGVPVIDRLKALEQAVKLGEAQPLWIGGWKIGPDKMIISSIDEDWKRYYLHGELTHASVALTFREYVDRTGGS